MLGLKEILFNLLTVLNEIIITFQLFLAEQTIAVEVNTIKLRITIRIGNAQILFTNFIYCTIGIVQAFNTCVGFFNTFRCSTGTGVRTRNTITSNARLNTGAEQGIGTVSIARTLGSHITGVATLIADPTSFTGIARTINTRTSNARLNTGAEQGIGTVSIARTLGSHITGVATLIADLTSFTGIARTINTLTSNARLNTGAEQGIGTVSIARTRGCSNRHKKTVNL